MLKNIKQDIKNIILLLFIVGILSIIIYISVYSNKEYTKNINLDVETYNYKKSEELDNNETIELESMIPIKDYILDIKFKGDQLIALSDNITKNKTQLNVYDIDVESKNIDNVEHLTSSNDVVYRMGSISPSREIIVYDSIDENNFKSNIYNLEDKSISTLDYYFDLLGWLPDSSGFYGYNKGNLFEYNIDENKINNKHNLKNYGYIDKVEFSQDGTKLYALNISKNEITIYDLKKDTEKKINSIKNIYNFEVINDENLIIEAINSTKNELYIYNLKNNNKNIVKGIQLNEMYLSKDKSKLIAIYYTGNNESTIDIYNISLYGGKADFHKMGTIPMIKGIPRVDISDKNKLAYSIQGSSYDESNVYIYKITSKK
ncbi:MAG: hypothetical protein ACRCYC_06095 [Paraclostridium sp.]|uniref:hypothetical protein n=1 Tax=Paraclostridium sp. TaxID=2023273 RepID=UPI003F327212